MSQIQYVNLADLTLPDFQAHKNIQNDNIHELAESIKSIGIIEPLIIRTTDTGLEIVAGCLRYHAARIAGLKAVPCLNMSLDPLAAEIIKLHENIKRIPLDHIDQGATFIMMQETFNMSESVIAGHVGKSIAYVSQHISLVRLDNELTLSVKEKRITFSQARELMRLDDPAERHRLLLFCQHNGATISVLHGWVQDHLRESVPIPAPESDDTPAPTFQNNPHVSRLCEACGISVDIAAIRQVFYCPDCDNAIKHAILSEKLDKQQKPPE